MDSAAASSRRRVAFPVALTALGVMVCLAVRAGPAGAAEQSATMPAEDTPAALKLVPTPRRVERTLGVFALAADTPVVLGKADDEDDTFAAEQLIQEASAGLKLTLKIAPQAPAAPGRMVLIGRAGRDKAVDEALARGRIDLRDKLGRQGYVLWVRPDGVLVAARGAEGVFYGVQTLKQLLRANARGAEIPCCRIVDWPALQYRCWQNDVSRGPIPTLDFLKRQVRTLSEFKLNSFTMYTENVFKNPKHPKIAPPDGITADEVKELCAYAGKYHVEVFGNHQAFGHYEKTLRIPEYAHLGENGWVLTPAKEETYRFLADVFEAIAPAYESPLFVINCDETYGLGEGPSKDMVKRMGIGGVYAYHINRLYKLLQKYGKTPLLWGDIALHHRDIVPGLPKDLIVLSWGYDPKPSFDDAIKPFTDMGLRFMVCPGVSNWAWIWPDHRTAVVNISNYVRDGARHGAMGMLNTTWGDDGEQLFSYTWYPQVWAGEVSWLPATPPEAKDAGEFRKRSEEVRGERLSAFDRAFPGVFYGLGDDSLTQAMWKLADLRKVPFTEGLNDTAFWRDPFLLPHANVQAGKRNAETLAQDAQDIIASFRAAKSSARCNADGLDFAIFAARRAGFLGRRVVTRISNAEAFGETLPARKGEAAAALREALSRLESLRKEVEDLRAEYVRLWGLENRPGWLATVLKRYDGLIAQVKTVQGETQKAASELEQKGVWPDAARLRLDLPGGGGGRNTSATLQAADEKMAAAAWLDPQARWRLPIVWNAGRNPRTDAPMELVLPLSKMLPAGAAPGGDAFLLAELTADGKQAAVAAQVDPQADAKVRLAAIVPGPTPAGQKRVFFLYVGGSGAADKAKPPGAVSVKQDGRGGYWVENDRCRAHVMPSGAHVYAFHVKALGGLDVTLSGEQNWQGFSDAGPSGRDAAYALGLEASGPVMARIRCTTRTGVEKALTFWAGAGWFEAVLEHGIGYYWDFDDPSVMGRESKTPGEYLFSDASKGAVGPVDQVSAARPNTTWGLKRRGDGFTLASITPGASCTHRVGPGGGMGGVGIEGGGEAWHFVTFCDAVKDDPAAVCNTLGATLDLRSQPAMAVGPIQSRPAD